MRNNFTSSFKGPYKIDKPVDFLAEIGNGREITKYDVIFL